MQNSAYLSEDDVFVLTGYKQPGKQKLALAAMGIEFSVRVRDGRPIVPVASVPQTHQGSSEYEPRFGSLEVAE